MSNGPNQCTVCQSQLSAVAKDKGQWYWCPGCGSLFVASNGDPTPRLQRSPGTLAALRAAIPGSPCRCD